MNKLQKKSEKGRKKLTATERYSILKITAPQTEDITGAQNTEI